MLFLWLFLLIVAILVIVGLGRMHSNNDVDLFESSTESDWWALFIMIVAVAGAVASIVLFGFEAAVLYSK